MLMHNISSYCTIFLVFFFALLSSEVGTGDGSIYIVLLVFIGEYGIHDAIPICMAVVFIWYLISFCTNIRKRHPTFTCSVINSEIVKIVTPMAIGGTLIGVIFNNILPDLYIMLCIFAVLLITTGKTLQNAIIMHKKETYFLSRPAFNEICLLNLSRLIDCENSISANKTQHDNRNFFSDLSIEMSNIRRMPLHFESYDDIVLGQETFNEKGKFNSHADGASDKKLLEQHNFLINSTRFSVLNNCQYTELHDSCNHITSKYEHNSKSYADSFDFIESQRDIIYKSTFADNIAISQEIKNFSSIEPHSFTRLSQLMISDEQNKQNDMSICTPSLNNMSTEGNATSNSSSTLTIKDATGENFTITTTSTTEVTDTMATTTSHSTPSANLLTYNIVYPNVDSNSVVNIESVNGFSRWSAYRRSTLDRCKSICIQLSLRNVIIDTIVLSVLFSLIILSGRVLNQNCTMNNVKGCIFVILVLCCVILVHSIFTVQILSSTTQYQRFATLELLYCIMKALPIVMLSFLDKKWGKQIRNPRFKYCHVQSGFPLTLNEDVSINSHWTPEKCVIFGITGAFGGICSGLLGIGGGLLLSTIFEMFGYDPIVSFASSSACNLFISASTMFQYFLAGRMQLSDSIFFGLLTSFSGILGIHLIFLFTRRCYRRSYIIFLLFLSMSSICIFTLFKAIMTRNNLTMNITQN